jgi:mannose-1-phosphate guanylyltransferase / mannose-6-phosphate isomerase
VAEAGGIVTFGISPDRAETGYGWLDLGPGAGGLSAGPQKLARFVEKPDAARAAEMLAAGPRYLWNAGLFLALPEVIVAAFRAHAPDLVAPVSGAVQAAAADLGFIRLAPAPWQATPAISLDYAVMEKAGNLSVMPYAGGWSDLGDWQAVWHESPADPAGNAVSPGATAIDCEGTLLRAEGTGLQLVGIGLSDMVAVAMRDAVLVAPRSRAQEVRQAVAALKSAKAPQATQFPRDDRPWGWFESLALGPRFQVKRIVVHPGRSLSLQSHHHRAEHWIVVQGTAKVTVGADERLVTENQSVYIPLGAIHRLHNPGKVDMVLIEVQTGTYLGEDDIVRHQDDWKRT